MPAPANEKLVTVGRYGFLHEAQAAQLALEACDIPARLNGVEIVQTDWMLGNAVGDVRLDVAGHDESRARAVLAEIETRRKEERPAGDVCLACGAEFPEESARCGQCGWSFEEGEQDIAFPPPLTDAERPQEYDEDQPPFLTRMNIFARLGLTAVVTWWLVWFVLAAGTGLMWFLWW